MRDLPVRKPNRLRDYDYSQNNAYFITICTKERRELLGKVIVGGGFHAAPNVGGGFHAVPMGGFPATSDDVGDGFGAAHSGRRDAPYIELSEIGKEIVKTIEYINTKYRDVNINQYVIMPNHIHLMVFLTGGHGNQLTGGHGNPLTGGHGNQLTGGHGNPLTGGHGNPLTGGHGNPPLQDVIGRFKSFTTKKWNELCRTEMQEMWQRSYHDHIIRNEEDYQNHLQYIDENPGKWAEDKYYNGDR